MYNLNDVLQIMRFQLNYVLQGIPCIILHFVALLIFRLIVLRLVSLNTVSNEVYFFSDRIRQYQFSLLIVMLAFSDVATVLIINLFNFIFSFSGDFIFMAGVLLGARLGWPILFFNLISKFFLLYWLGRDAVWIFYNLTDSVTYFVVGSFSGIALRALNGDYHWGDVILVCVNKVMAFVVSAAIWVFLMQESWVSFFNIMIFRLVGWPVGSLPMIVLFLFLIKQDWRRFSTQVVPDGWVNKKPA
ncbi:hypothetical protein DBR44_07135 [Aquitalea sp. FJL05]|uniref:hypothetical protein n=1 Tax=Aquitalea sp. FJL05 TaxID=2153366 RepID=UPI000F5A3ABA|nr:hypothetical protein [Aquitalea sp. FJL05]RQO75914.1 hypothetical protein DBR44_07135 [Aquitalea sp. FJL05]